MFICWFDEIESLMVHTIILYYEIVKSFFSNFSSDAIEANSL